ncbi:hypothetical protein K9K85_00845 [Patescibacteria group bacterium]|nr:hypothetical protein [Patescibacteria group bacterium]
MNLDFLTNQYLLLFYLEQGIYYFVRFFFGYGIWILLTLFILRIFWKRWTKKNKKKYLAQQKYVLLGIIMPKYNEQGPETLERFFAHLSGIREKFSWWAKKIEGKTQLKISLEIVSFGGKVQFFIHTPVQFQDLVESAIYTCYPFLEIFEAQEDYAVKTQEKFNEGEVDIWGADLHLAEKNPIPISTYLQFEHKLSKELKDPLTDLLEILGRMREGEEAWVQYVISPIDSGLKKEGEGMIADLLAGKKSNSGKNNIIDKIVAGLMKLSQDAVEFIKNVFDLHPTTDEFEDKKKGDSKTSSVDKRLIEAIQNKIAKIAFRAVVRIVYVAEREIFVKNKGSVSLFSSFNSFQSMNLNRFKKSSWAKVSKGDWNKNKVLNLKKAKLLKTYQKRDFSWRVRTGLPKIIDDVKKFLAISGSSPEEKTILNIEELATLYHFPTDITKSSAIRKSTGKKAESPTDLPVG